MESSLKECLGTLKNSWKELDLLSKLSENWESLVGIELSKECKPIKIEKGCLFIGASHPQWRQALIYNNHFLKESITKKGFQIKDIKIEQFHHKSSNNNQIELTLKNL